MIINDEIFGKLEYDYIWSRETNINFYGMESKIELIVKGGADGKFDEEQYLAYSSLMQKWEQLQQSFVLSILEYYKQKRYELGYDVQVDENYPPIETEEEILKNITLAGIVVSYAGSFDGRDVGITFDCTWDEENGVGLRLVNEKIIEVGYQDLAM